MRRERLIRVLFISLLFAVAILGAVYIGSKAGREAKTELTDTYLAYLNSHRASVHLVDPDDPTSPVQVSSDPVIDAYWFLMAVDSYNFGTKAYSNLHIHSVFWIEEADGDTGSLNGGPLMRVYLGKSSGMPVPERISGLDDACYILWFFDDPVNRRIFTVVRTAGEDKSCYTSDDGKVFVHSGMTRADIPADMTDREIVSPIYGEGISGFLIFEDDSVLRCSINLTSCGPPLLRGVNRVKKLAVDPVRRSIYICADGKLYIFDGEGLNSVGTPCGSIRNTLYDDTAVYAVSSGNLLKLPHGGASWETIYDGGDARFIEGLTRDHVIISTAEGLKVVKKDGTSRFTVEGKYIYGWAAANSFVYTRSDRSRAKYACLWKEGASNPTCTPNAYWAGFSLARDGIIDAPGGFAIPLYRLLKVEEVSYDSRGKVVGGVLYAVDPADPSSKIRLGSVPPDLTIFGFGIGDRILLVGFNRSQSDVLYADLSTPGSLRRVTDTADVDEVPVFYPSGPPRLPNLRPLISLLY